MPANPKDLYNSLKDAGELSISYADFREQWDTPGWNVEFHKHLRQRQLTSLNYNDFVFTFSDNDPTWDSEKGIEISQEELDAASNEGKEQADDQQPRNLAQDSTGFPLADGTWVLPEDKPKLEQANKIIDATPEKAKTSQATLDALQSMYGNDLDAKIAEANVQMAGQGVTSYLEGMDEYIANLDKGIPKQESDDTALALDYTLAAAANIPKQWEASWESTKALGMAWADNVMGPDVADLISGEGSFTKAIEFIDPVTKKGISYKDNPKRWNELNALNARLDTEVPARYKGTNTTVGVAANEWIAEKFHDIEKINETMYKTGSIVKGAREGSAVELYGGFMNAIGSVAATVAPAMLSGGYTLAPQVISPMWVDYNQTKANTMFADSEDPIRALIDAEEVEFAVPMALGAGALALEGIGFKGISKYMGGSLVGKGIVNFSQNKLGWILSGGKEGLTEWLQVGMESMNTSAAEGKSFGSGIDAAAQLMFSDEGLEAFLQGMVGGMGMTAPSAAKRTLQRALHSDPKGHKIITEGINDIAKLKEARLNAKSKVTRDVIDRDIKAVESRIKTVLNDNNSLIKHMSDKENKQLRSIIKRKDQIGVDLQAIEDAVKNGDMTAKEGGYAKRRLNAENVNLSNEISDLKANIDLSKIRSDVKLAQKLSKNLPNLKIQSFTNQADVRSSIEGARNEKGELYTKEQLDTFAKESAGLFWEVDGVEHIVINESLSAGAGLTTTGQHEFLHKVLNRVLKADPSLAMKMGGAVKETIKKLSDAGMIGGKKNPVTGRSYLSERLSEYTGKSDSVQAEELITVLSEAIEAGEIKITEESRGFFGDIKELVRRSMLDFGIKNVSLEGDGVMQFIKDYNREYQRGKLSRATKNLMTGKKPSKIDKIGVAIKDAISTKKKPTVKEEKGKGKQKGMSQSLDSNETVWSWGEETAYGVETEPALIGESEITLSINKSGNIQLMKEFPELGLNPERPVYTIAFSDEQTEYAATGHGDPFAVFGSVVNGMKEKLGEMGASQIIFSGAPEGNRQRLYDLMAGTIAHKMGYEFESLVLPKRVSYIPKGDKVYAITKPTGGMKQSKKTEGDLYERTNKLYQEYADDKHTAGFLIGMEWQNQIEKLARKYRNLPGYDVNIEDVVSYVMTANQGIPGLVNSFKPGTKTKDGKNDVSLEGYINKYLPNYINKALGKHGIGDAKDEGGFAGNIDDAKNITSGDTAEDSLNLNERNESEIEEDTRRPQLKDVVEIDKHPELKTGIETKVVRNINSSIKFFGKAKTRNEKIDAFIKETRKGIKNDEKAAGEFYDFIISQGVENFLIDNKNAFLENTQRNDLQRSPLFKKAVQQRFKGKWKSREAYTVNGKTSYEYLKDDGTPYPARHPDMDRDKMVETGTTAGHYKYRKVSNFDQAISNNEFVDYFFTDGETRKKIHKTRLAGLASQFSSEIGLEMFAEQLQEREGAIFDVLSSRVELTSEMTPDQVKEANERQLIIREGMAAILTDKGINETLKDLERGGIKQSKVNKTGFSWFDSPRIEMTNYLAGLENNDIRTGVVDGSIKSPEYTELYEEMKDAYDMYLGMQVHQDEWASNLQNYSNAFKDKDFANFDQFVDHTLGQVNNSVNGILGTNPKDTSLGKRNEVNKAIARKEGIDGFINDSLKDLPIAERSAALADMIKTLVGATSSNFYENTPGFYRDVVQPMIKKHGIKPSDFSLVEIEGGTTIHHKGKKITTEFAKGMYAEDTFGMFDVLAENIPVISNSVDVTSRIADAKEAKKLYTNYLKWMRANHKRMSPNTVAMMLKALGNGRRSVAQVMIPLTKTMMVKQANEMDSYTTVPSVPGKYINIASLKYIMTGKGLGSLGRVIDGASQAVLPKVYAKIVDQFHHNTPNNNFNSDKVNNKLNELDLPKIDLTDLTTDDSINVIDVEGRAKVIKFNKTVETIGESMKFSKVPKGISVWDFDDTLAKTKSNILYTLPGQTRIYHGGEIKSTKDINGFAYFSEDQDQATAYAEGNQGDVNSFMLDETDIATEDAVFAVIDELGIKPRNGWSVEESHLYELIDPRFEQAFSKNDREKLATALKKKGIKAARFTDTNIAQGKNGGREIENIVVFNKKAVKPQNKLTAAEFAAQSDQMAEEGASFDFSEFSKVVQGQKGPLFDTAVKRNEKFGNEHVYILTARPQNSAHAIHEFLKGIGLDIKIENITGLQDSSPQAKADWVNAKASEGYNDFYFADDHISNVQAVKEILDAVDVKSDVVQAGMKQSSIVSKQFNEMLERTLGIEGLAKQKVRTGDAHLAGQAKDRTFKWKPRLFVPPTAEDFAGLLYKFAGKGKQGDADLAFLTEHLIEPYIQGVERLDVMNTAINLEYKNLQVAHPEVVKKLHDTVEGTSYTYDMAIRYYLYERSGYGEMMQGAISPKNGLKLMKEVLGDKKLRAYADALSIASRQKSGYVEPDVNNWLTQSIATDFRRLITDAHRKNVLADFITNVEEIFSTENLNKIESVYGTKFRKALFNTNTKDAPGIVQRMISGRAGRGNGNKVTNWINGAIAPIMFLNQRSGLLQLLSAGNFINWSDNNPAMVAKAMANPKQFYADMVFILKSPKMTQRRNGLRFSIEEAELANVGGAEGAWGVFHKRMIKLGFMPTQIFDGLAIALGGASFYRNRLNTYLKKGMTQEEAQATAWKDFGKISDEAQQSSDQMLTSAEQAGGLGRIILAFSNTPAQYTRIMKKAALDIANGRGDLKTNLSKIAYYGFLQNLIFSSLQTALVASYGIFADDDEEERHDKYRKEIYANAFADARAPRKGSKKPKNSVIVAKQIADEAVAVYNRKIAKRLQEKKDRVGNGMVDTVLRGLGTRGAVISALKNTLLEILAQKDNRAALNEAKHGTNQDIALLYEKVLAGDITLADAEEGEKRLKELLLEIDPGTPLANNAKILLAALSISPPISAKARDVNKMLANERFNKDVIAKKGWAWDSPRWQTVGLGLKTATNLPGDYIPKKIEIIKQIIEGDGTDSQKAMMGLGWSPYDMGLIDNEFETIKEEAKLKRKEESADRAQTKRDLKKLKEAAFKTTLTPGERKRLAAEAKRDRSAAGKKAAATRKKNKLNKNRALWEEAQRAAKQRRN